MLIDHTKNRATLELIIDDLIKEVLNEGPMQFIAKFSLVASTVPISEDKLRPIIHKLPLKMLMKNQNMSFSEEFVVELQLKGLL